MCGKGVLVSLVRIIEQIYKKAVALYIRNFSTIWRFHKKKHNERISFHIVQCTRGQYEEFSMQQHECTQINYKVAKAARSAK